MAISQPFHQAGAPPPGHGAHGAHGSGHLSWPPLAAKPTLPAENAARVLGAGVWAVGGGEMMGKSWAKTTKMLENYEENGEFMMKMMEQE